MPLILMFLMTALVAAGASSPTVEERSEFYDVPGSSDSEMRANMNRLRPKDSSGQPADAVTYWTLSWSPRFMKSANTCAVASVATTLELVMKYPRWSERQAGTTLGERWDRFMIALKNHEEGHAEIGRSGAAVMHERLSRLTAPTCPQLETLVNSTGDALLDEVKRENEAYDQRTGHGATQGVRFP